jgi:hypothetical protein
MPRYSPALEYDTFVSRLHTSTVEQKDAHAALRDDRTELVVDVPPRARRRRRRAQLDARLDDICIPLSSRPPAPSNVSDTPKG